MHFAGGAWLCNVAMHHELILDVLLQVFTVLRHQLHILVVRQMTDISVTVSSAGLQNPNALFNLIADETARFE